MTAEGADEIGVFDFLVEIANEGASSEVTACDFVEGAFLFRTGRWVENSHHTVHSTYGEKLLDSHVVFLRTDKREQFTFQIIAPRVFLYQSLRTCIERYTDNLRTLSFVFCGIYSMAPLMMLAGVIAIRSDTRQPIKH